MREAALTAMRRIMEELPPAELVEEESEEFLDMLRVSRRDFEEAMKKVRPSITPYMVEYYRNFEESRKSKVEKKGGPDYYTF